MAATPHDLTDVLPAETCVLRYAIERHASTRPTETFAVFETGESWTFAQTLDEVRRMAAGLARLGVRQGDRVLMVLPNGTWSIRTMFAINYLGAVFVPVNPAYRGALLAHVLRNADAALAIVHPALLRRILDLAIPTIHRIAVAAEDIEPYTENNVEISGAASLRAEPGLVPPPERPIAPWHEQSIIYTSGTTGHSKGVLSSYMHSYSAVSPDTWTGNRPDDRQLIHMPVFHIGGAFIACVALCVGGSIAVVESFRTETFWQTVRALQVTSVFLLGAMATFLLKQPESPDDRDHPLRMVYIVPLGQSGPPFHERFGVEVFTLFNMTEISTPLISGPNPAKPAICGRPRAGVELRLVDEHDRPVPPGRPGQLIIRTSAPWAMNHGYHNNPEATVAAWRNGWFHTGDAFIVDEDGDFQFIDRLKDSIRRRGENISSYEVEVELLAHPDVREAAAIPVPSDTSEDEVMAVIAPIPGRSIDPAALLEFLRPRLAPFMLPRYVRIVGDLPKTPTAKVQKHLLREAGITADIWDREKAGIRVRREKLS